MIHSELVSASSRRVAPGRDAVPAEDAADRLRVRLLDRGDVQAQLESRPPPRHPGDLVAEDRLGQLLPVRRGRDRDPRVRMQMIDMRGIDQPVHRRVDTRRRPALAMQAVVERRHHLVLPLDPGINVHQRLQPVQPQHRQTLGLQRPEVPTGPLDPHQLDGLPRHRVDLAALRRRVPPGVVGVLGVRAQRFDRAISSQRSVATALSCGMRCDSGLRSVEA